MGHRANLVLVEHGAYRLYYSHWCANTLPKDLFWGPEYAVRFTRLQQEADESGWLDEVWAEGGSVVDLDRRTLLLYGGEDIQRDVPLRRVYLELLDRVWSPWEVRWAYEGIAAMADHVGYPRDRVLVLREPELPESFAPPEEIGWADVLVSIRWESGQLRCYHLAGYPEDYLAWGPALLTAAREETGLARFPSAGWPDCFPNGGLHLDVPSRTVEFWIAVDAPDAARRVGAAWPGWTVRWHKDDYSFQAERTNGRAGFAIPDRPTLESQLVEILLHQGGRSGADTVRELADRFRAEGKSVETSPWALRDDRLEIPPEVRLRIVEQALGRRLST